MQNFTAHFQSQSLTFYPKPNAFSFWFSSLVGPNLSRECSFDLALQQRVQHISLGILSSHTTVSLNAI